MKNILLIMPYGGVGGMERVAYNFYNQYKSQGYTVKAIKIIQLESDIIHFEEDEIALSKIDFNQMSFLKRFWFYCKIPFFIHKIIKKYKITHSISFGDMANFFSSLSLSREFKIASLHSFKSVEFKNKNFLNFIFKIAFKTTYYFFDKVVCISETVKKDLIENCGFIFIKKLQVIYNPHNFNEIEQLSNISLDNEFENYLFENKVILFLGRLTEVKAPWHLLKAYSILNDSSVKLVFVGDGDENLTENLNKLVDKLGIKDNVTFLGRKSNPYPYLKKSSLLALTSNYEGTPNVIVEAISLGIPIVTSNCTDGIRELMSYKEFEFRDDFFITESGIITPNFYKGNLSIFENSDITSEEIIFAKAIVSVMNSAEYSTKLIKNRKQLLAKFDMENISKTYLN